MFFFDKFFSGKGLNFTDINLSKYPPVKTYKVSVIPKYDFILADFAKFIHIESDLINLARCLKFDKHLIIIQSISHEENYNEVFYHKDLLYKNNLELINFESDETFNYFVFKKKEPKDSIFLGVFSVDKEKTINSLISITKNELLNKHFLLLKIYGEDNIWMDESFYSRIPKFSLKCVFSRYKEDWIENNENAYNWNKILNICKSKKLLLTNDDFDATTFNYETKYSNSHIFIPDVKKARQIGGIDFKYKTLEWSIYDFATRMGDKIQEPQYHEHDKNRYESKKNKSLLDNSIRWITVHEALGDNISAFNLLETINKNNKLVVSTAYPFLYELSGDITLRNNLEELNGLGFNVYEHGSELHSRTIEYAYFSMNGEEDLYHKKRTKFFYNDFNINKIKQEYKNKQIVLIAPSASNREGPSNGLMKSNKSWDFAKWEKIVSYLQSKNYYVIQVGAKEDFKVENVNEFFFNKPFGELTALIAYSKFFIGLDTFFQHLCGLMGKKGIVVTPDHNDHAFWPGIVYIVGTVKEKFENLKWIKDHLNPYRAPCMQSISYETVQQEVDKIIDCFNKY